MGEHHFTNGGQLINRVESSHQMDNIIRDNRKRRAADLSSSNGRTATLVGNCIHDGCTDAGYDLTEGYCSTHFVTNVLGELEEILHDANENWIATVHAESNNKSIWRCLCGFVGTMATRELHFVAHNGDTSHGPPVHNRMVQTTQTTGRKRVTTPTAPDLSKVEEIG